MIHLYQSLWQYSFNKNIRFKTPMLRSDLCDYSDAYLVVKVTLDIGIAGNNAMTQNDVVLKNYAQFRWCISKTNDTFIFNAEGFDIAMPMYSLLEHSDKYFIASGSLWNYYRDELDNANDNASNGK